VKDANFALKDGFNLTYDLEATGLNAASQNDGSPDLDDMSFKRLKLQFTDQSIIDKGMKLAADMQGTSPALIKMQAKGALMFLPAMASGPEQTQALTELSESVGKLIDNGGTLTVSLNPSAPVKLSEIQGLSQNPDQGLDKLGLSVSHKP